MAMLPPIEHPNLMLGVNAADDGGVYKVRDDLALIQTVDVFTPVVDDPFAYGQIAAANSLSDIYAMGGTPVTALNIIGFPKSLLSLEVLAEIIKGAIAKTEEAGCPIVGGHTIVDEELKFGLSVTGTVHPDRVKTNSGAKPGDKLVLTKPLGMGILTTALKNGKLEDETIEKITKIMAELNKTAAELLQEFNATAITDITGFGLLGHGYEMAKHSNVSFLLSANDIHYLPEAIAKMEEGGFVPGGTFNNKMFVQDYVSYGDGVTDNEQIIFCDAQTSGGLLVSLPAAEAENYLNALKKNGVEYGAIIGDITEKKDKYIYIEK